MVLGYIRILFFKYIPYVEFKARFFRNWLNGSNKYILSLKVNIADWSLTPGRIYLI